MNLSACISLCCVLSLVLAGSVAAQETCDLSVQEHNESAAARFVQISRCGDGDTTNIFTCSKSAGEVTVVLPVAPFDASVGDTVKVKIEADTLRFWKTFTVTAPAKDGGEDEGGSITLKTDDPLWKLLASPGKDVIADNGDFSTNVGTAADAAGKLEAFKSACGL